MSHFFVDGDTTRIQRRADVAAMATLRYIMTDPRMNVVTIGEAAYIEERLRFYAEAVMRSEDTANYISLVERSFEPFDAADLAGLAITHLDKEIQKVLSVPHL